VFDTRAANRRTQAPQAPKTTNGNLCAPISGRRVASLAGVFIAFDILASLAICITFLGKFREISDMFGLSLEMKKVGAFFVLYLRECA